MTRPTLDMKITIYFLTMLASFCSVGLMYLILFGPLFTLTLWFIFYLCIRSKPYVKHWSWVDVLFIIASTYTMALILAFVSFYIIMSDLPFILQIVWVGGSMLCFLNSLFLFGRQLYQAISYDKSVAH